MIQRIQTVYLFLAFAAFIAVFIFPVFTITTGIDLSFTMATDDLWISLLNGIAAFVTFVSIFLYKDRKLQLKIVWLAIILSIITLCIIAFLYFSDSVVPTQSVFIREASIMPLIALIFLIMARRGIRKDQELIASLNRIR